MCILKWHVLTFSSCEKLFIRITIDSDLKSGKRISGLCDKVSKRMIVLCQVTGYVSLEKRTVVIKTCVQSQFNYCLLIWMLHSRTLNNKINCLHERALRIAYFDYKYYLILFLKKDGSFYIHHRNIQSLAIERYKFFHGLSPAILDDIIKLNRPPS